MSPNGAYSRLANALKKRAGAHHICYEADDLDRACEDLRQQAMLLLCKPVPAKAFPHRRIAWVMDRSAILVELLERGTGPLSLASISGGLK